MLYHFKKKQVEKFLSNSSLVLEQCKDYEVRIKPHIGQIVSQMVSILINLNIARTFLFTLNETPNIATSFPP